MSKYLVFLLLLGLFSLSACSSKKSGSSSDSSVEAEASYCADVATVSSPTTITSNAYFRARQVSTSGLGAATAAKPIRYAEVVVQDSSGAIIQCGTTSVTGAISVQIPSVAGTYKLVVKSRADNSYVKASILDNPTSNRPFSISTDFTVDGTGGTVDVGSMTASHTGSLEGGAFNILDQIYLSNQYIRDHSTAGQCSGCTAFTVAPKAKVYWSPGVNPGVYFGFPDVGLSFFTITSDADQRALYILGGMNGDTNNTDTDHFDNSIVIHEYGHFLENAYANTDSPGGSHNGNFVIDPRLAWGEGWANFFASAVQNEAYYRDTIGNEDGSTGLVLSFNLGATTNVQKSGQDRPTFAGEGNFRELSVSRTLWQIIQAANVNIDFAFLWFTFTDTTAGFNESDLHFRSSGMFWDRLKVNVPNASLADLNTALGDEFQDAETQDYGRTLASSSCANITLQPSLDQLYVESSEYRQNLQRSNDFYKINHTGGPLTLRIRYFQTGSPSTDLDLYILSEDYTYDGAEAEGVVASSVRSYPESGGAGAEIVSVDLAAGTYMVNVRARTSSWEIQADVGSAVTYQFDSNGVQLCPQ